MPSEAYIQIRTALDSTTEVFGGDQRTGVGAVFINKEIDRMIKETINKSTDFRQRVPRNTMRQLAYMWNLETSIGSTAKTAFYDDGGTGTPYPNQYLQLYAQAKALRGDYSVTGITIAASSSYFSALEKEARSALQALALTEEQAMILGDDASSESTGITLNGKVGVSGAYKGLKQLLSSAVAVAEGSTGGFADASAAYGSTRSSTVTDREYALNVSTVATSVLATSALSTNNLNSAITRSNIKGGKTARRMFLCSEDRLDEISDLIAPNGRFVQGGSAVELDGGVSVLRWKNINIVGSRFMAFLGVTTTNGSSVTFADTDNCVLLLDMDSISFYNVAGVDARHVPINGTDASNRSDVVGGYFKTYGVFVVEKFNTHVVIYNLTAPA